MPGFDMADYKEVAERLAELFAKHPGASLRGTYEFVTIGDQARVVYRAECYRMPDDPAPAVGTAWEDIPGKTPYTRGSELQNAETSAWGRAIVAAGASTSKRIASADEMRSAQSRQNAEGAKSQGKSEGVGTTAPVAASSAGSAGDASSPPAPGASPAVSKNRVGQLQSKLVLMQADGFRLDPHRKRLGLPLLNNECTDEQLDQYAALLNEHDNDLNRVPV